MTSDPSAGVCLIRRVVIRNYKSIAACDVELRPLTFLVGPNGSGKSNFLDALRFVSDALQDSLGHAIRSRGGIAEIRRHSRDYPSHFGIRLEFDLPTGAHGHYAITIGGPTSLQNEECFITGGVDTKSERHFFRVSQGIVQESTLALEPAVTPDRLFLVNASGTPDFRPVYDALSGMGFYNLNPDIIRDLQTPGFRGRLARDGSNLVSVLQQLEAAAPHLKSRIEEYLSQVVPGIHAVDPVPVGPRETLVFAQRLADGDRPFLASSMSDGTLRALAILVALFQSGAEHEPAPSLVGLEEPETALHPAATGVLIDSMRDATSVRQVLVTSHSPDLLDNPSIADSEILAVNADEGETRVGHLDEAGRSVLRDHLFTAGDLLRMNQLRPDPASRALSPDDLELFGAGATA
ncbi:AAA family ATPase [Longimicrobium sp.]|uniref:AAA family ATPase n=1 Tax=Longimicrobium sp. TaxID=2029185 RepID=UPI003B3BAE4D